MKQPQTAHHQHQPAAHLSNDAQELWNSVLAAYNLEVHHLRLLQAACEALDRAAEARRQTDKEGSYYTDRFGQPREHPGLKVERDSKVLYARLLRELCLDIEAPEDHRIPGLY